jgi:intron-binding protein aquarius
MLITGELWPSQRIIADEGGKKTLPGETVMEGVEHLGQYVYEMTNAKLKQLRAERGLPEDAELPPVAEEVEEDLMTYGEDDDEEPVDGFETEE